MGGGEKGGLLRQNKVSNGSPQNESGQVGWWERGKETR